MFKGSNVALITPFKNNSLDEEAYIKLIHFHMDNGTSGLVPAGTTGESPTLNHDEHQRVIDLCINESNGKIPVIAGTGSNSTEEAISLTSHAEKADLAVLATTATTATNALSVSGSIEAVTFDSSGSFHISGSDVIFAGLSTSIPACSPNLLEIAILLVLNWLNN